jgi:hypothetical protein
MSSQRRSQKDTKIDKKNKTIWKIIYYIWDLLQRLEDSHHIQWIPQDQTT